MKNSTYWRKRFDEIAQIQFDKADEAEKELIRAYQKADLYIKERICLYYERYAKDYAISLYDSEKLLSASELDDFRMTLEEFKDKAINNQDEKWTRELEEEYLRSRISRLQALKFEINNKIKELKHEQDKINIPHLKDVYSDTFYRTAYELEKGTGIGVNFGKLNDKTIEKAIYTKWLNNKNFAGRTDDNKANLISNLDKIITQGMILGSSSDEMVQKLMKATKVSRSRAINLIQTETTYIIGRANTDMYKEFGVKEYDVIETLDSVTCETCAAMDSKRFKVSEKMEGVNAPPFHPRCRGTTVPVSKYEDIWGKDDRIARDENGVTYYKTEVGDMSYEEYMEYKGITKEFTKNNEYDIRLTDDEQYAINKYISSDFYTINEKLRQNENLSEIERKLCDDLDSALEKLPNYSGNVRRSLILNSEELEEFLKEHQKDKIVNYRAYTSTTFGERYNNDSNVELYILDSRFGKDMTMFNEEEKEVLYFRNSKFIVDEIEKINDTYHILLREV